MSDEVKSLEEQENVETAAEDTEVEAKVEETPEVADTTVEASSEAEVTTTADEPKNDSDAEETADEVVEGAGGINEGLATGDSEAFKWYIAKTMTGQENKVTRALKERVVNYRLTESFSQILCPEETVVTNTNGKKRTIKKKFFPGYVLIKMIMDDKTWHLVKNTEKITGFVGGTVDKPTPISEEEAAFMTNQMKDGFKKPRTSINFEEGETVKVTEGPFASFVGTVEAVSDKGKLKVNVSIFGRPTPVELDFTQVEKVS